MKLNLVNKKGKGSILPKAPITNNFSLCKRIANNNVGIINYFFLIYLWGNYVLSVKNLSLKNMCNTHTLLNFHRGSHLIKGSVYITTRQIVLGHIILINNSEHNSLTNVAISVLLIRQ